MSGAGNSAKASAQSVDRGGARRFPRQFGKYTLLAHLAEGGMGALYLGCQGEAGMEKLCAVKTVLPQLADKEYVARFRDEAKVVVRLSHGNLVPVFDAGTAKGEHGDELYLAMEFVEGKDLRAVWNRCAKKGIAFPVDIAVYIARELARGLYHAHTAGAIKLVHRDVSPPNVLLSFSGEVKLTDFGLAASTLKTEKTAPGVIYGKVSYMSPEQARGEPLDGRTDLYAVGVILWELLTGRQLFPQHEQNLIVRVRDPQIPPPSQVASRVPPALDVIVGKALAKDKTLRYADCEAFRAALSGFLAQHAPTTDNDRVARFLETLFGDDIQKERAERQEMLDKLAEHRARVAAEASQTSSKPETVSLAPTAAPPAGAREIIGSYLDDRYLVKRLIGEGGMGLVYEAEHVEIGRRVAVKVLHAMYTRQPEVVARFRAEARAATRIGHPHIIEVLDSGTTVDGAVYFVMEYLQGTNLSDLIHSSGPLPQKRAVAIAREVCQALAAAHKAGIVHRDMKPENVFLLDREGHPDFVKVLDFGIAKTLEGSGAERVGRLTSPGIAMGTPEYMAPEQAAGLPTDHRVDIYAVGAMMYEMLTGRVPHEGGNVMEILTKKATQLAAPVGQLRPDVHRELERLVMRTLAMKPEERPQTMEELSAELGRLVGIEGPSSSVVAGAGAGAGVGAPSPSGASPSSLASSSGAGAAARSGRAPASPSEAVPSGAQRSLGTERVPRSRTPVLVAAGVALATVGVGGALLFRNRAPEPTARPIVAPAGPAAPVVDRAAVVGAATAEPIAPAAPSVAADPPKADPPKADPPKADPPKSPPVIAVAGVTVRRPVKAGETAASPVAAPAAAPASPHGAPDPAADARAAVKKTLAEARAALADKRYSQAEALFTQAQATAPGPALTGLAEVAFAKGSWADAVRTARRAVDAGGGIPAHLVLGDSYARLKKWDDAAAEYRDILKTHPSHAEAQRRLAAAERKELP
jgi:serine/threonine protein kinase